MRKQITKAMLPAPNPHVHLLLFCTGKCGSEYSADPGDYWNVEDDHVFKHCHRLMRLVRKRTIHEDVA